MKAEIFYPKDEAEWLGLRDQDVTSTEVSALFDLSPYETRLELWCRKADMYSTDFEHTERTRWGLRLQDAIAQGLAEDHGWNIRRMTEYMRRPDIRLGASFDFAIEPDGLLEIKNVDSLIFRDGWAEDDDGGFEAPPHIEMQIQVQLALSGRKRAYLGAFVGGNKAVIVERHPDPQIIARIEQEVAEFWLSIKENRRPAINWDRDAAFLCRLYAYAEEGKEVDRRGDADFLTLCKNYKDIADQAKALDVKKKAAKAQVLMAIGDAHKTLGDGFTVSAGMIAGGKVEYERESYRDFRINWKRERNDKGTTKT